MYEVRLIDGTVLKIDGNCLHNRQDPTADATVEIWNAEYDPVIGKFVTNTYGPNSIVFFAPLSSILSVCKI